MKQLWTDPVKSRAEDDFVFSRCMVWARGSYGEIWGNTEAPEGLWNFERQDWVSGTPFTPKEFQL